MLRQGWQVRPPAHKGKTVPTEEQHLVVALQQSFQFVMAIRDMRPKGVVHVVISECQRYQVSSDRHGKCPAAVQEGSWLCGIAEHTVVAISQSFYAL